MSILRPRTGALLASLASCALLWFVARPLAVSPLPSAAHAEVLEVRGLWILRSSLTSPQSIANLVRTARASGFNTLFVQVRGRGEAFYQSAIDPRADELRSQPASFDPLAQVIAAAHDTGMRVHAWVNVGLISSAAQLPEDRTHVIYRHPDWLMVPRAIVQELTGIDGHSPAYAGKISRWTRTQPERVEGLYLSPIVPDAAAYTESVIAELVERYAVDGVHLDYLRYPSAEFDYSRYAVAAFRSEIAGALPHAIKAALDARAEIDPFAYPDGLQDDWTQFRRRRLSSLAMRLRSVIKKARPDALVTAAVVPDPDEAFSARLQDWRTWTESGILDAICPMAYSPDPDTFAQQIATARAIAGSRAVWAGIGAWRLSPEQTIVHIGLARKAGAAGLLLFSYDSLTGPAQARGDYLGEVARAAFQTGAAPANGGTR